MYSLYAPFIAAESQHHEESHLIYGPFESTLLDQGFPVEYELHVIHHLQEHFYVASNFCHVYCEV